jgi:hypothetical protein
MSVYEPRNLDEAIRLSQIIAKSGFKFGAKRPEEILMVIMAGAEMGVPPMAALQHIYVMQGRIVPSARLILARAKAHPECEYFQIASEDERQATYRAKRKGGDEASSTYTIEDATRAGLTRNPTWKKHPREMLRARASAALARDLFADAAIGLLMSEDDAPEDAPAPTQSPAIPVHDEGWQDACADQARLVSESTGEDERKVKAMIWTELQMRAAGGAFLIKDIQSIAADLIGSKGQT